MEYEIPAGVKMSPDLWEKADLMYANGVVNPVQTALEITDWKQVTCPHCDDAFLKPSGWREGCLCADCTAD